MNPQNENTFLSPKSDHSGRGARNGSNTTATSASYHSDPFASSNLDEDVQAKDYSYVKSRTPKSETPRPRGFINDHTSPPSSNVKAKIACFETSNSPGGDRGDDRDDERAPSEWETVAADDEFAPYPEVTTKAQRRQGKSNFTSKTDAIVHPHIMSWGQPTETSNPVSRRDPVRQPSVRLEQASSPRLRTFQSSSSLYSELDKRERKGHKQALHSDGAEPDTTYCEGERAEEVLQDEDDLPVQGGLQVPQNHDLLKRASAATTSSRGDPFHYDGERYSDFLRSSVERDNVDEQVKVPVGRQPEEEPSPEPIQDRRLGGDIVTLLKHRTEAQGGTEADWQTVTTENHPYDSMRQEFHDSIAKGTGSSLADVSDTTERNHHLYEYGSMDRIIQHPSRDVNTGSYRVRNDKRSRLPVLVPQGGGRPGLFAQNATRNLVQSPPRTPASLAGLFRKDGHGQTAKRRSLLLDEERRDSYQTLSSDAGASKAHDNGESSAAGGLFSWPRVNKNLGREPPKTPPTILDKPLYKRDFEEGREQAHVPHDAFLQETSTIHMDLISLPEAAMLQRFRRQRGEEDHTETGAAFAARKGYGSIGSPLGSPSSSTFPMTPRSHASITSPGSTVPRPAPAHHPERANRNGLLRRRDSSERISEMLVPSSAILGSTGTDSRFGTNRGWCGDNIQPFNSFHEDEPRFNRGTASTFGRRSNNGRGDHSGVELVDFTWGNVLHRRQQPDDAEDHRQKRVFVSIVILTILFPFIGVLAIRNKLDAMIPWATEGEMHTLTKPQRRTLKFLLLALAVLYPALITGLVVYYAIGEHLRERKLTVYPDDGTGARRKGQRTWEASKLGLVSAESWGANSKGEAERAKKYLGWEPKGVSLKETIAEVVALEAKKLGLTAK
ncbi:hypothetical protein N0V84_008362 [Fusarium piperis]|uniref:Uncharacterized protein n=1 Tax=Fusarium piperis TaxID=1435070 RepID=A0A9W9BK19_9HYPO|nr:hypothetical protein N0V84_008362 [Fusarium piperis]